MRHPARMGLLLLLFVVLPAVELALLVEIGARIGTVATVGLIVVTGIVGASLARWQGLGVVRELQRETAAGQLPAGSLVDGAAILVAGALLVTPGVLTDAFGFACLVPAFRGLLKRFLLRRLERAVEQGQVQLHVQTSEPWGPREEREVRDVRETDPTDDDASKGRLPG